MNISLVEFYWGDFFKDILDDLSVEVTSKKIDFIFPDKIPNLLLNGDKKRLSQVMYNLVSNSIKYSREDGRIEIRDKCGEYLEDDNFKFIVMEKRRVSF